MSLETSRIIDYFSRVYLDGRTMPVVTVQPDALEFAEIFARQKSQNFLNYDSGEWSRPQTREERDSRRINVNEGYVFEYELNRRLGADNLEAWKARSLETTGPDVGYDHVEGALVQTCDVKAIVLTDGSKPWAEYSLYASPALKADVYVVGAWTRACWLKELVVLGCADRELVRSNAGRKEHGKLTIKLSKLMPLTKELEEKFAQQS